MVTDEAGAELDGTSTYADVGATDPAFQSTFGSGPGCRAASPLESNEPIQAVPPVRMRDVADHSGRTLTSICTSDLRDNLTASVATFISGCG